MPLIGSEKVLADKLKALMKTARDYDDAWDKLAKLIVDHVTTNSIVTGACPSGGGPLVNGKVA